ncbi:MAG: LD-carboxypeptidase [Candidatus Protistobacter heckmanni]|nr:LD-carboxypeptidase [Candidatus Protistobacter heckmanni]
MIRPLNIHLIAPSAPPADPAEARRGVERLRAMGHAVGNEACIERRHQRFAGTDEERLAELNALARLPDDVDMVMAIRGGYGASRLLSRIDFPAIAARAFHKPFAFIGHSDITALQMGLLSHGVASLAGPMLVPDLGREQLNLEMLASFEGAFAQRVELAWDCGMRQDNLSAEGMLWGGNLAMLCSLIGTPWLPRVEGGILFIEDINEHPYRIERMLLQLLDAGVLWNQSAILVGDVSGYRLASPGEHGYDHGYDLAAALDHVRGRLRAPRPSARRSPSPFEAAAGGARAALSDGPASPGPTRALARGVPILSGLEFGHIPGKLTLPVGAPARLEVRGSRVTLSCPSWPLDPA